MTEEVKSDVKSDEEIVDKQDKQEQTPELTPLEQEMVAQGWKPKDQWEGNEEEYVGAAEFKRRGELFKKIADTNRRLEKAQQALTALTVHQRQTYEAGYKKALVDLRAQHAVAVENGDVKLADQIVDKIEETKAAQIKVAAMPEVQPEAPVALVDFKERNSSWYEKDEVMTAYADRVGHDYARTQMAAGRRPEMDDILGHVDKKVREKFPASFGAKRTATSVVDGGDTSSTRQTTTRRDTFQLSADERKVMRNFVDNDVMTEAEYIADLKRIKGVK